MKRDSCGQMSEDLGPEEGGAKPKANCSAAETGFSADGLPGISAARRMEAKISLRTKEILREISR